MLNKAEFSRKIRKKLREGQYSLGSWMQIPNGSVAEIMGQAGYDWVAIDMEHGSFSTHQLPDLFRALELGGTMPLVRLAQGHAKDCKQALDAGAGGVIVPMIENAAQLVSVRDACRWPPAGTRGVGFSRANLFGNYFDQYSEEAQAPFLVAMIEHIRAVDQLEEILTVEGLDAILIGPYDLSASLNLTAKFEYKDYLVALQRIRDLCFKYKIPCGIHVVNPSVEQLRNRIDEGYRFLPFSIDSVLLNKAASNPLV